MNCKECLSNIDEYFDNGLDLETADRMDAHLFACGMCQVVYEDLKHEQETYSRYLLKIKEKPTAWDSVRREIRNTGTVADSQDETGDSGFYKWFPGAIVRQPFLATLCVLLLMSSVGFSLWYRAYLHKIVSGVASSSANEKKDELNSTHATADLKTNPVRSESKRQEDYKRRTPKDLLTTPSVRTSYKKKSAEPTNPLDDAINESQEVFDSSEVALNRHIEKCEMVLRSFRHAVIEKDKADFDISYERRLASELLNNSIKFRHEAQNQGNLPIENLLVDLETILGDITQLPKKATSSNANLIKERIQKSGIIPKLQVQSSIARASD